MGCCLSTRGHRHLDMDSIGGAPPTSPPHVLDVETVKEVLLETPAAAVVPNPNDRIKGLMPPGNQEWKEAAGTPPPAALIHGGPDPQGKSDDEEIVSEVSEMCSYSESYSNATAAQDKKLDGGDEDGVVNQRPPVRARLGVAGGRGRGRGRSGERVISRRKASAAPSPEKRGHVAPLRSVHGRSTAGQQRNVAVEESVRQQEAGDASRRRSRSLVARRNASDEKSAAAGARDPPNDVVPEEEAESIENPVVSLECFIFL